MIVLCLILHIYSRTKSLPSIFLPFLCLSRRIHSIFMLRMFNDCIAMMFCYIAIIFFINNKWLRGCILFSVAVSVKMNVLLFAPGLLLLLIQRLGLVKAIIHVGVCGIVQVQD